MGKVIHASNRDWKNVEVEMQPRPIGGWVDRSTTVFDDGEFQTGEANNGPKQKICEGSFSPGQATKNQKMAEKFLVIHDEPITVPVQ
jgi:hypothetical protein